MALKYTFALSALILLSGCSRYTSASLDPCEGTLGVVLEQPAMGVQQLNDDYKVFSAADMYELERLEGRGDDAGTGKLIISRLSDAVARHDGEARYPGVLKEAADACIANQGGGHWVGSSQVTLADFCTGTADLVVLSYARADIPAEF